MSKSARGFTLIELLVVISIIAILSVVGLVIFQNAQKSAKDAKIKADLNAIKKAYETNFDPTLNGGQGGYRKLKTTDFAGNQIPGPYTYAYGPDAAGKEEDGYQVSATLSDGETSIKVTSTQGTLAGTGILSTPSCPSSLSDNLVGHWKMDESPGSRAKDYSGAGNDGTLNGTSWQTTDCKLGLSCLNFNGTSNYVATQNPLTLNANFTLSVWIKLQSKTGDWKQSQGIIAEYPNGGIILEADPAGNNINFYAGSNWITASISLGGAWHHIVVVRQGSSASIYIDNTPVVSGTSGNSTGGFPLRIGYTGDYSRYFSGLLDDVRIYSRALSLSDISSLYNGGSGCTQ